MEIDFDELTREFPYELGTDVEYIETIDNGSFGTVIKAFDLASNQEIAIKVISKDEKNHSQIDKLKEEISILRILKHPNIVKFYGYMETNNQLLIKMEYIKYGSLKQWINKKEKISEEEASIIIKKILSAIEYLHSKHICHRDIKPENIMLSRENDLNSIKIIDFGLSAQNFDKLINNDYCGTYIYMAPELIEKKLYSNSVDIWSIGILMFILLNDGKHPFYIIGDNRSEVAKKIKLGKIIFYKKISLMAKHLMMKLLEPIPSWRYTASQAIKHPWITRNINDVPPITFNELLKKSNNKKIMEAFFNTCLFLNYFSNRNNLQFIINKKYIQKCTFFSEKNKIKVEKRRRKCLDADSNDEEEKNKSHDSENNEDDLIYNRYKIKEQSSSVFIRNRVRSLLIRKKQKLSMDNRGSNNTKIKGSNKIFNLLKRYQNDKVIRNNLKVKNQKTEIINAQKINLRNNINHEFKLEKKRNHNSMKNLTNLTLNKNNSVYICKFVNEENSKEKNKEEYNIKPLNIIYPKEKPQKIYNYSSNRKSGYNFPKLRTLKPNKLFKNNKQNLLTGIENYNYIPIILPNLETLGKTREKHVNKKKVTFIKIRTIK